MSSSLSAIFFFFSSSFNFLLISSIFLSYNIFSCSSFSFCFFSLICLWASNTISCSYFSCSLLRSLYCKFFNSSLSLFIKFSKFVSSTLFSSIVLLYCIFFLSSILSCIIWIFISILFNSFCCSSNFFSNISFFIFNSSIFSLISWNLNSIYFLSNLSLFIICSLVILSLSFLLSEFL